MLVAQLCPTLCDTMDCSPPGSTDHGILQARTLEWAAISFSTDINFLKKFGVDQTSHEAKLSDLGSGNRLLKITPKVRKTKTQRANKIEFYQNLKLLYIKGHYPKSKKDKPHDWRKYLQIYLIRVYNRKSLRTLTIQQQKEKSPIKKWAKYLTTYSKKIY